MPSYSSVVNGVDFSPAAERERERERGLFLGEVQRRLEQIEAEERGVSVEELRAQAGGTGRPCGTERRRTGRPGTGGSGEQRRRGRRRRPAPPRSAHPVPYTGAVGDAAPGAGGRGPAGNPAPLAPPGLGIAAGRDGAAGDWRSALDAALATVRPYGAARTGGERAFDVAGGTLGGVAGAATAEEDATWQERAGRFASGAVAGSLVGPTARGGLGAAVARSADRSVTDGTLGITPSGGARSLGGRTGPR